MKVYIIYLLVTALAFGCIVSHTQEEQPATEAVEIMETVAETTAEAPPETTVPPTTETEIVYEGDLYLTISSIMFSLPGETEDIYCGTIPREEITWTSGDESVVVVENGVLTAAGVGETTISAQYQDQYIECQAGCLASSEEELENCSIDVLQSPRKKPPVGDSQPCHFFDDAAIIGDSVTYGLCLWAGQTGELGDATFLVRGGMSLNRWALGSGTVSYQGKNYPLDKAVAASGVKKIFIMMGANDLGFKTVEETIENVDILMERILALCPDMEIYLESCLPVWDAGKQAAKNAIVEEYNLALQAYAEEKGFHYLEVASYIKDHTGGMAKSYCSDFSVHMNYDGTDAWMQALKLYGWTQMEEITE